MLYPHLLMASIVGMNIREIADILGINYRTVQQRMAAMGVKTHVFFVPARDQMKLVMAIDDCMRQWLQKQIQDVPIGSILPAESRKLDALLHEIANRLHELDEAHKKASDPVLTESAIDAIQGIIKHGTLSAAAGGNNSRKASMSVILRRAGIVSVRAALPDECAEKIRDLAATCLQELLDAGH